MNIARRRHSEEPSPIGTPACRNIPTFPLPQDHQTPTKDSSISNLRLGREWSFDESRRIGAPGGFGDVYEGFGADGHSVAVKRIRPTTPVLAAGEIRVARALMLQPRDHVLPVLDAGTDLGSGHYFIVMPRAEESLQDRLDREGAMRDDEAMSVLSDVLFGLQDLDGIVHGDLKPANVLFHENRWKLADLGFARNSDEAPSNLSERMFVSDAYAAPEQWNLDAATRATDVYAFGCLAYAVLTGQPPFPGPRQRDYSAQHLEETPRELPASPPVRALVQMCLAKDRTSRPSIDTALVLLRRAWVKS